LGGRARFDDAARSGERVVVTSASPFAPLTFSHGPAMANRFMLAPLTNLQSHPDGTLSDEELHWLTLRAQGGFGATMTCAAQVDAGGQGFPGQLGIQTDAHTEGMARIADALRRAGSVSLVQLHHAGIRSPRELIGTDPVGPSANEETGARALSTGEVEDLVDRFAQAALRCDRAGVDGIELHGAHGYLICAFLSPETNRRDDRYGGSPENRARFLYEVLREVRSRCRPDFQVGVRLSPERFGLRTGEMLALSEALLADEAVDFLDLSLWDCAKKPEDPAFADRLLIEHFAELPRHGARLGVAGKLMQPEDVLRALSYGVDFVLLGRAAILSADFPAAMQREEPFVAPSLPVTRAHLDAQGVSPAFLTYLTGWKGFVAD
jgi:2,4-dienoyl-CoA reductase-like NADH-dependent reductase (Old Yellow Enzyme family)